jgi:hypothetical protein
MRALVGLTCVVVICGCNKPKTPEQEFDDLAWSLMKPLKVGTSCHQIGADLADWEKSNGARLRELAGKVTKLTGGYAKNYRTVQARFDEVAHFCVHPPATSAIRIDSMSHDDDVERAYKQLPRFQLGYELR